DLLLDLLLLLPLFPLFPLFPLLPLLPLFEFEFKFESALLLFPFGRDGWWFEVTAECCKR
ncbi:MAG: hypothetical protein ACD_80C00184G0002, partial [uncultured bacterium (gcode 4)]